MKRRNRAQRLLRLTAVYLLLLPFLLLGFTFLLTGTLWCLLLACAAAPFGGLLRKQPVVGKMMNRISGMVFVGLGLKIGLSR